MDVEIKGSAVTKIEDTRLIMALESMRRVAGQTYVRGTFHLHLCAVARDVRKTAFEPDVQFIARMAVVRDCVISRYPQQNFTTAFGKITAKACDLNPRR